MNQSWIIFGIFMFSMVSIGQTLPVFAQVSDAINQGIDLSGDMISDAVQTAVPVNNAGEITREGFSILKAIFNVMRQVHHFVTMLITAIATEGMSEDEAKKMADIIGIGSIVATVAIGLMLLKGVWRHVFLIALIIFLVIIGASFLDNQFNLGF